MQEKFEKQLAEYFGTKYAIVCSSGRSAIRFSLLAIGVKPGDEVVIPDYSCEVIPITVFCTGAVSKFCDIQRETLSMSPYKFKKMVGPKTKAVVIVHLYGLPAYSRSILELSQEKGIFIIDDAAQALGASIKNKKVGSLGDVGIISFNKFLNVKLGGAIVTDNEELAEKIRTIREKCEIKPFITRLGYRLIEAIRIKSRKAMTAVFLGDQYIAKLHYSRRKHFKRINGWISVDYSIREIWKSNKLTDKMITQLMAMGRKYWHRRRLEKLEILELQREFQNLERNIEKRREIAKIYEKNLTEDYFTKIIPMNGSIPSYMKYPIILESEKQYSKCIAKIVQQGFKVDCIYRPLHDSPLFNVENKNASFCESTYVARHLLPLPVDPCMDTKSVHNLIDILNSQTKT